MWFNPQSRLQSSRFKHNELTTLLHTLATYLVSLTTVWLQCKESISSLSVLSYISKSCLCVRVMHVFHCSVSKATFLLHSELLDLVQPTLWREKEPVCLKWYKSLFMQHRHGVGPRCCFTVSKPAFLLYLQSGSGTFSNSWFELDVLCIMCCIIWARLPQCWHSCRGRRVQHHHAMCSSALSFQLARW